MSGSETSLIGALYNFLIGSRNTRQVVIPAGAAGKAIVSDGVVGAWAWAPAIQIAAAMPAIPCWLVGTDILVWDLVATDQAHIAIQAAAVDLAITAMYCDVAAGAGVYRTAIRDRYFPIEVAEAAVLNGRIRKASAASGTGATVVAVFRV